MEIKKGDWFKCVEAGTSIFTEGGYYKSKGDGKLVSDRGVQVSNLCSKFVKLYTIQDLKDCKVAVLDDGTLEELQTTLNLEYPLSVDSPRGVAHYRTSVNHKYWTRNDNNQMPDIPVQSGKDFLVQLTTDNKDMKRQTGQGPELEEVFGFGSSLKLEASNRLSTVRGYFDRVSQDRYEKVAVLQQTIAKLQAELAQLQQKKQMETTKKVITITGQGVKGPTLGKKEMDAILEAASIMGRAGFQVNVSETSFDVTKP